MAEYFEKPSRTKVDLSDEQMFKELFVGYFAPLCNFAQKYVGNFNDEDIVSAVFSNMYQKRLTFDSVDDFVFYLYRSVKNKCLDEIKSDDRMMSRNQVYSEELEHDNLFNQIVENEVLAETYREIQSLPTYSKRIIELSYFEGFSNQEIADEMQLSLQTIKNYKRHAVASLRTALLRKIMSFLFFLLVGTSVKLEASARVSRMLMFSSLAAKIPYSGAAHTFSVGHLAKGHVRHTWMSPFKAWVNQRT